MPGPATFALALLPLAPIQLAAAPAGPPDLVLNCYVTQSSSLGLGQFVRHLRVEPGHAIVVIADALNGQAPRYVGTARLVSFDADRLVYDFASTNSAGRTQIDRHTGSFSYNDGRRVVRGTCEPSEL